jgi:hypothetical protein
LGRIKEQQYCRCFAQALQNDYSCKLLADSMSAGFSGAQKRSDDAQKGI